MEDQPKFSSQKLAEFNGQDGKPAYVAYNGRVFDVSTSKRWPKGAHMNRHHAGHDLTADLASAPHDPSVLDQFPQVGVLESEETETADAHLPLFVRVMIDAFPFMRRHPHPMTVHFPIVFMMFSAVFALLYVTSGVKSFETTSLHLLGAGVVFTMVAMVTGFLTWWINYMARPMKSVIVKIVLSTIMLITAIIDFVWRLVDPAILDHTWGLSLIYLVTMVAFIPEISVIGFLGADLTFPLEGRHKKEESK